MESMDEAENIEMDKTTQKETQPEGQAFDEQEMTHVMPSEGADEDDVDASSDQKELPETAANEHEQELPVDDDSEEDNEPVNLEYQPEQVEETAGSERQLSRLRNEEDESGEEEYVNEHEQALPAYVDSEEEEDEISSLTQQPEVAEEAASDTGVMDGRGKDEVEGRADVHEVVQHCFNFPSKRERKLSDEEQQEEAKRPKSPEREGVQLAEQHGSGGEGGEEMQTERPQFRFDMTKEQLDQYCNAMEQEYKGQYVSVFDSARRQQHFK